MSKDAHNIEENSMLEHKSHALTMCVLYHHEVHFYENFKRRQKCKK